MSNSLTTSGIRLVLFAVKVFFVIQNLGRVHHCSIWQIMVRDFSSKSSYHYRVHGVKPLTQLLSEEFQPWVRKLTYVHLFHRLKNDAVECYVLNVFTFCPSYSTITLFYVTFVNILTFLLQNQGGGGGRDTFCRRRQFMPELAALKHIHVYCRRDEIFTLHILSSMRIQAKVCRIYRLLSSQIVKHFMRIFGFKFIYSGVSPRSCHHSTQFSCMHNLSLRCKD